MAHLTVGGAVLDRIRTDILTGVLEPRRQLRIDFMSERYGASSTSVREALTRLSSVGLVDYAENRGFSVALAGVDELLDLARTFAWLEEKALRESMAHRTVAGEEAIVLAFHRLSREPVFAADRPDAPSLAWERAHRAFHRSLIAECRSRRLLEFCEQLYHQFFRYSNIALGTRYRDRDILSEHRAIMDSVIAGDVEGSVRLLVEHYAAATEAIRQALDGDGASADGPARG